MVIIVDNGSYGTIRMHQERDYPERVSGTDLVNPILRRSPAHMAPGRSWWSAPRISPRRSTGLKAGYPAASLKTDVEQISNQTTDSTLRSRG